MPISDGAGYAARASFSATLHRFLYQLLGLLQADAPPSEAAGLLKDTSQESLVLAILARPLSAADADWILASGLIKRLHAVARRRSDSLSHAALHAVVRTAVGVVPALRPDESVLRVVLEQLEALPEAPLHACRMLQLLVLMLTPATDERLATELCDRAVPLLASLLERRGLSDDVHLLALRLLGTLLPNANPLMLPSLARRFCVDLGKGMWRSLAGPSNDELKASRVSSRPSQEMPSSGGGWLWGSPAMVTRELPVYGIFLKRKIEVGKRPSGIRIALPSCLLALDCVHVSAVSVDATAAKKGPVEWLRRIAVKTEHEQSDQTAAQEEAALEDAELDDQPEVQVQVLAAQRDTDAQGREGVLQSVVAMQGSASLSFEELRHHHYLKGRTSKSDDLPFDATSETRVSVVDGVIEAPVLEEPKASHVLMYIFLRFDLAIPLPLKKIDAPTRALSALWSADASDDVQITQNLNSASRALPEFGVPLSLVEGDTVTLTNDGTALLKDQIELGNGRYTITLRVNQASTPGGAYVGLALDSAESARLAGTNHMVNRSDHNTCKRFSWTRIVRFERCTPRVSITLSVGVCMLV